MDYAEHRTDFPVQLADVLAARGLLGPDVAAVDLGTGTGALARLVAPRVASVVGVDPSAPMIEQARRLDREAGVSVSYRVATAEETGLTDGCADLVLAGQCWHWFDADRAATEVARLLRPHGHLVIVHFDWIPLPGNVVEATERLIEQYNPAWTMGGGAGVHPRWLVDLGRDGFGDLVTFSFDVVVPYSHHRWVGRVRASAGVGASLPPGQAEHFSVALTDVLAERWPDDPIAVPHRVWAVIATTPH
jgi:SAM-dependent methyltransferase